MAAPGESGQGLAVPAVPHPRILLAFPAVQGADDPLFAALQPLWSAAGLRVELLPLDLRADDTALRHQVVDAALGGPVVLGGFSRGARIAALVAPSVRPLGLLCFGYPFHARSDPQDRPGLAALRAVRAPTLIVQGSRDPHGDRPQVRSYGALPDCVRVHWLDDGNHRLTPRLRSGHTAAGHLRDAATASVEFLMLTTRGTGA